MKDQKTLEKIQLLHPRLREEVTEIYEEICKALTGKAICRFTFTLRTFAEQDALFAQGRSKPGKIVTNAKGGMSYHNYGLAIDIVLLVDKDGNGTYETASWDTKGDFDKDGKNKSFLIIPKAIHAYFVYGTKPEEFLAQNTNILDYCAGVKSKGGWYFETRQLVDDVPEKYKNMSIEEKRQYLLANGWEQSWSDDNWVRHDAVSKEANTGLDTERAFNITVKKLSVVQKTKLQKIIRYFVSNQGNKIIKCHSDGREIQVESGPWLQTVINRIDKNKPFQDYDLNLKYYLEEIYKQIDQMEKIKPKSFTQLSLF